MAEAVRLVVWDLDETFWKGTLTEGGYEYVQEHHDIVVELAKRGILSSICSKNDHETIVKILEEHGILEYFVFPSISWEPKGMRLQALVETVQLRAPTIMFIDDNPNNRAEASAIVPGLQVEDETFISRMLTDARFKGKDDSELSRLKQYKLLEARKRDAEQTPAGNEEFLRHCDVRVYIEYDVMPHLDRAIELINRTNQLNYTKKRLPEDIEEARAALRKEIAAASRPCGLVRVIDKYGDYGFVGFFLTQYRIPNGKADGPEAVDIQLVHYCFSCRTLGMLIEQWVFEYLGRPRLNVVGEVLTDLSVPRVIDWVRLVHSLDPGAAEQQYSIPKIVLWAGCEGNSLSMYLKAYTKDIDVIGSYAAGALFVVTNSSVLIDEHTSRTADEFADEAKIFDLPQERNVPNIFRNDPPGTVYIINSSFDTSQVPLYRHNSRGWVLHAQPLIGRGLEFKLPEDEFRKAVSEHPSLTDEQRTQLLTARKHLDENYTNIRPLTNGDFVRAWRNVIDRVPLGSKLIIVTNHDEAKNQENTGVYRLPAITQYTALVRSIAADYDYVDVVSYSEVLQSKDEICPGGGTHYARRVFWALAERVIGVLADMPEKTATGGQAPALIRKSA